MRCRWRGTIHRIISGHSVHATLLRLRPVWLGLTPRAHCSGGKDRSGRISKMGDRYLRRLLVNGMTSQLQSVRRHPDSHPWAIDLLHRKPAKLVAVAMANKAARIAWVVMTRDETYRVPQSATQEAAA